MSSEEEKRKSILDFYEGKTKIRHGEARYEVDALLVKAAEATANTATQILEIYGDTLEPARIHELEEIRHQAEAMTHVPEEERWFSWAGLIADGQRRTNAILEKLHDEQTRERKEAESGRDEAERGRKIDRLILIVLNVVGWLIALGVIQRLLSG